jgi:hypothetical protein
MDIHRLAETKRRVKSIEDAHVRVRAVYPDAALHGSVGSYHWQSGPGTDRYAGELVAEAWMHRREGWWLRIKPRGEAG